MTQLDQTKYQAINLLKNICIRCKEEIDHICPVQQVSREIEAINGIPIIVNDRLYHVMFS